jgi:DNA-binding response OmpR family regulator
MKRIMIVDDEPSIRKLYQKEFAEDGYEVILASSGQDALNRAENEKSLDLVILDIKMEGKDGLEVLDELRGKFKGLPVILNSAYSTYKNDFTSWLADAYLVKSPDLSELKEKVRELLTV